MGRGKQIYMYELRLNSAELEADILIESFVNSQTADNVPGPEVEVGEFVSRNFTVTNPGSVSLTNVVVIDDNGIRDDRSDDFNPMPNLLGNELNLRDLDQDGELDPWRDVATQYSAYCNWRAVYESNRGCGRCERNYRRGL